VLILPTRADARLARHRTGLDVRIAGGGALVAGGQNLAATIVGLLGGSGAGRRLGVVGLRGIMSAGDAERLAAGLGDREIVDATSLLDEVKLIKSADDVRDIARTAAIVDAGFDGLRRRIRVGATPWELAGEVQGVVRGLGARDALVFVTAGPYTPTAPVGDPLRAGDLVSGLVELAGPTGFWAEYSGLFALGELDGERARLAHACLDAAASAAALLRPGAPVAAVAEAIDAAAQSVSAQSGIWHGHGVGVDHDLPLIGPAEKRRFEPGMVLAVHPNFSESEERFGAMVADTYVIEQSNARRLSEIDQRLHQVNS
jgi:Xaa-Pro aminopeptidase